MGHSFPYFFGQMEDCEIVVRACIDLLLVHHYALVAARSHAGLHQCCSWLLVYHQLKHIKRWDGRHMFGGVEDGRGCPTGLSPHALRGS